MLSPSGSRIDPVSRWLKHCLMNATFSNLRFLACVFNARQYSVVKDLDCVQQPVSHFTLLREMLTNCCKYLMDWFWLV